MALFDGVAAPRGSHSKAELERDENNRGRRARHVVAKGNGPNWWKKYEARALAGASWPMWRDIEWNHYDAQPTEPRYHLDD